MMVVDIVESLMKGEDMYPRSFVSAQAFWKDFYSQHGDDSEEDLQKAIDDSQMPFQWRLEKDADLIPPFAKSIMALTAIGSLYKDGFEDAALAKRVLKAFIGSKSLSLDVKSAAQEVDKMYSFALTS